MKYYLDGHNMIHRLPELRSLISVNHEAAREELVRLGCAFHECTGADVVVVFDGNERLSGQEDSLPFHLPKGVSVRYSEKGNTADSMIERQVFLAADKKAVTVVTGDIAVTHLIAGMGAPCISLQQFINILAEGQRSLQSQIATVSRRRRTRLREWLTDEMRAKLEQLKATLR